MRNRVPFLALSLLIGLSGCRHPSAIPSQWVVREQALGEAAPIHFRFPPPIEGYSGEVTKLNGELTLGPGGVFCGATGWFLVNVNDVTLGEPDLDDSVRHSVEFLEVGRFPTSRFDVTSISSDRPAPTKGQGTKVTLSGFFTLKGVAIPLNADGDIELVDDAVGSRQLLLNAHFSLEQLREKFRISGPGGENESSGNHMLFEVSTRLAEARG